MKSASIAQHPLYASISRHGRHATARLRQVPSRYWRMLAMALILLWIVYNLAKAFWVVVPAPELEQPPLAPPPEVAEGGAPAADVDLASLQAAELFGVASAEPVPEAAPQPEVLPGVEEGAVETSLDLQLQGVIASSSVDNAWAIISSGNSQSLYRVGDTLPQGNNVTLAKVLDQRVILNNNGNYESLWLYSKEDAERRAGASPQQQYDTSYMDEEDYAQDSYSDGSEASDFESGGEDEVAAEMDSDAEPAEDAEVRTLPQEAVERVSSINDVVRFTAARGEDGMVGYRLQPGRERALFDRAGLQSGDIVTAVNGISLDNPQQIRAVYQELQTAAQAELSIMRDGEPVSISISLD